MIDLPVADPGAVYRRYQSEIDAAVARVLGSGWYVLGPEVESFEKEFGELLDLPYSVGVASGTDAVELAVRGCGIGPGDEVVTVSQTAVATVAAIERAGASAVLVDVRADGLTMDPAALEEALSSRPQVKAVVVVHLYGRPADLEQILAVAAPRGIDVVEDCAQSHGARFRGRAVGAFGRASAFSFYPTKNLGAFGDGGLVATSDAGLADRVRGLRQYGWGERYVSEVPGLNSRLDPLQAAILAALLPHLSDLNAHRRAIALRYDEALRGLEGITLPALDRDGTEQVWHQYTIRCTRRSDLQDALAFAGIGSAILYPVPVHLQPAYANRLVCIGDLAETERAVNEILSLPIGLHVSESDACRVAEVIRQWVVGR
jgi:dTDP-4-amino-4,6-dideoxygalactose transaminase